MRDVEEAPPPPSPPPPSDPQSLSPKPDLPETDLVVTDSAPLVTTDLPSPISMTTTAPTWGKVPPESTVETGESLLPFNALL